MKCIDTLALVLYAIHLSSGLVKAAVTRFGLVGKACKNLANINKLAQIKAS